MQSYFTLGIVLRTYVALPELLTPNVMFLSSIKQLPRHDYGPSQEVSTKASSQTQTNGHVPQCTKAKARCSKRT